MSVIGLRVGPFEIVEPTTVPEPGDWYRARRTGMTRRQPTEVLVKLLPPDADGPARYGLQTMFDTLRAVEDARVPVAVDVYEGIGALALDAPDGVSFSDIVEARNLGSIEMSPPTLLDIALEIAECLQHAHHRNRHHGHLGAHNIRLSTAGKLHLFGFGPGPDCEPDDAWMAPERRMGQPATAATDQWSLAAVMVGLIGGTPPAGDADSIVEPLERQWPALARLFRRMLEEDPSSRFGSMHPVRQELIALARKAGGASERVSLGKRMARRVPRPVSPDVSPPGQFDEEVARPPVSLPASDADAQEDTAVTVAVDPPSTAEEMHVPEPRRALDTPPPPPVANRSPPLHTELRPLVDEAFAVVQHDIAPEEVPLARRHGQPAPVEYDEDISDEPTVRFNASMLADFDTGPRNADLESTELHSAMNVPGDFENSEINLVSDDVARALVVTDQGPELKGGAPTAVPITEVPEDSYEGIPTDTPLYPDPESIDRPIHDASELGLEPDLPMIEPIELTSDSETGATRIERFTPWLVLGMVVLMLLAVAFTLI